MLQMVTAGNGNSFSGVETEFNVMMIGDADHLIQSFDMKYTDNASTEQNEKAKNDLREWRESMRLS